jgi:hypothetical protein
MALAQLKVLKKKKKLRNKPYRLGKSGNKRTRIGRGRQVDQGGKENGGEGEQVWRLT